MMGKGFIDGRKMGGVFIEGSEGFDIEGVAPQKKNVGTSMLTITMGHHTAHTRILKPSVLEERPETVTVLSMEEKVTHTNELEYEIDNFIPQARKVSDGHNTIVDVNDLQPSRPFQVNLPTFTEASSGARLEQVIKSQPSSKKHGVQNNNQFKGENRIPRKDSSNQGRAIDAIRAQFNLETGGDDSDLPTVTYVGFADFTTTIADTVIVFTPRSGTPNKAVKPTMSKTKSIQPSKTRTPQFTLNTARKVPELSTSRNIEPELTLGSKSVSKTPSLTLFTLSSKKDNNVETVMVTKTAGTDITPDKNIIRDQHNDLYSSISTRRFNSVDFYPTGLVSSIGGTIIKNDMTTMLTTYVYGTYIDGQYAQIVQSTSSIFYLISKTSAAGIQPTNTFDIDMSPTDLPDITTEDYYYDYIDDPTTENLNYAVKEIYDNAIGTDGRSVNSSPKDQVLVDNKVDKNTFEEFLTPSPAYDSEDLLSETVLTYFTTYFTEGKTSVSTNYKTTSIFQSEIQTEQVPIITKDSTLTTLTTKIVDLTTLTTKIVDGFTFVESKIASPTTIMTSAKPSIAIIDVNRGFENYDEATEATTESFTESMSESMSESSTDSSIQDGFTERPPTNIDSSLNPEEDIHADFYPRTYYTTYTYYTTFYRSGVSNIVSSLETLTNVISDPAQHEDHKSLTPIVPTYPVTYYTTYTYWTTFFKENSTITTSSEKTISSIVTPTAPPTSTQKLQLFTLAPTVSSPSNVAATEPSSSEALTTFYTTYTYYTTTYLGEDTIVNSRFETLTSVVSATPTLSPQATPTPNLFDLFDTTDNPLTTEEAITEEAFDETPALETKPTGLLSTIRGSTVLDGTTTVFSTKVYGSYIDGLYAKIQSTTTQIITPTIVQVSPLATKELNINFNIPIAATPVLDSSLSEFSSDVITDATEALPEIDTTEEVEDVTSPPVKTSSPNRLAFPFRYRSSTRSRGFLPIPPRTQRPLASAVIGLTSENVLNTDEKEDVKPTSTGSPFRFGPISARPSSGGLRFRFQSSRAGEIQSKPSARPGLISSSRFRLESSRNIPFALSSPLSISSSIFPSTVRSIDTTKQLSTKKINSPENSKPSSKPSGLRPFSFRQRPSSGTRSSIPLNFRRDNEQTSDKPTGFPISRFSQIEPKFEKTTTKKPPTTPAPSNPFRIREQQSPADRRRRLFARNRPNLSKLFGSRKPGKTDLDNEASEFVPVYESVPEGFKEVYMGDDAAFDSNRAEFLPDEAASELIEVYLQADGSLIPVYQIENEGIEHVNDEVPRVRVRRQSFGARTRTSRGRGRTTVDASPTNDEPETQFTLEGPKTASRNTLPIRRRPSDNTRSTVPLGNIANRGFRRPSTDNNLRTSNRFSPSAPRVSRPRLPARNTPRAPTRLSSRRPTPARAPSRTPSRTTSRTPSRTPSRTLPRTPPRTPSRSTLPIRTSNRNRNSNPITDFRNRPPVNIVTEPPQIEASSDGTFVIDEFLTVTREVPVKVTLPLVENGRTIEKEVITASLQTEIIPADQITQTQIDGENRLLLSTVESGNTEVITKYFINVVPTTTVAFTTTFVQGRRTSASHIVPSTAYNIVTETSKKGAEVQNFLQLLLQQQQQQQNPLLAALGVNAQPITKEIVHTRSYVTTVTNLVSTSIPIIFRGKTVVTTVVDSMVEVVTATELSTETIITQATASPFGNANPLNQLLPLLLQNQLQQQSPQIRNQRQPSIDATAVEQLLEEKLRQEHKRKNREPVHNFQPVQLSPSVPEPVQSSVVTLYISGSRPGEFFTVLSTVPVDGEGSRIKRGSQRTKTVDQTALPQYIEADGGLYQLPDNYEEGDLDWYIMSAMNEIDTSDVTKVTPSLDSVLVYSKDFENAELGHDNVSPNIAPFLWEGPAEFTPLKRKVRSAQRGRFPSARKVKTGSVQQLFNGPGLSFQSRLISEQIQQLQPPTTYYTTFTYYTTLVDEFGREFVQSSENTVTKLATHGNVPIVDFTKTGAIPLNLQITEVPIQDKFTLEDAIVPGKPRPVPDPTFREPSPPFGPVIPHNVPNPTFTFTSVKPRRIVLTKKRPVSQENLPNLSRTVVTRKRPIGPKLHNDADINEQFKSPQKKENVPAFVTLKDSGFPDSVKEAEKVEAEEATSNGGHRRVTITRRRPVSQTTSAIITDETTTLAGGRRRVVVTRRLPTPQPTVVASPVRPLIGTVNTYYTVYSYLYTMINNGLPFSVSTREVTVSNKVEPTVVSLPPNFMTSKPEDGLYTLEVGDVTATLAERIHESLTTKIFLASATLVNLPDKVTRISLPNTESTVLKSSSLQSSLSADSDDSVTGTPFVTTSNFRATRIRGQTIQQNQEDFSTPTSSVTLTRTRNRGRIQATRPAVPSTSRPSGVRSRGRGSSRFTGIQRPRVTVTRRRPISPTTSEVKVVKATRNPSQNRVTPATREELEETTKSSPVFRTRERGRPASNQNNFFRITTEGTENLNLVTEEQITELKVEEKTTTTSTTTSTTTTPTTTTPKPTRPPRPSVRRDDIPIIRRPFDGRTPTRRPFVTQEDVEDSTSPRTFDGRTPTRRPFITQEDVEDTTSSRPFDGRTPTRRPFVTQEVVEDTTSHAPQLRFTSAPVTDEPSKPLPEEDSLVKPDLNVGEEDYYFYDDYYYDQLFGDTPLDEDLLTSENISATITPTATRDGPNIVKPTRFEITTSSFDIINALKHNRTASGIVPSRTRTGSQHTHTRTPTFELSPTSTLPSNVVYSTYSTTTFLPILGGEHSITLTIMTSTLVTLAEDNLHLITESPELYNPALSTVQSSASVSPFTLSPSVASGIDKTEEIRVITDTLANGEVTVSTISNIQPLSSFDPRAFGFTTPLDASRGENGRAVWPRPMVQGSHNQRLGARFSIGARHNLATKIMSNGVEVIVAGDKTHAPLPPEQTIGNNFDKFKRPITLPPSTLSDQMLLFSSHDSGAHKVTQTAGDPLMQTHTYFTTYTYYNTLLAADRPFVITSKEIKENVITIPLSSSGNFIERTQVKFDTQTYYTTNTFTKLDGDSGKSTTSKEVLTQVVITEAPTVERSTVTPISSVSTLVTKTYFTTFTYYNTVFSGDKAYVNSDTVVSSEVVTETTFVTKTPTLDLSGILKPSPALLPTLQDDEDELVVYATKTYYTTSTYLTTILEGSETITASRIEISSNVVTEPITSALSPAELQRLKSSLLASQSRLQTSSVEPQPQTVSYISLYDNVYKQLRTFFATYTHFTTLANGITKTRMETKTNVLTTTITTNSIPVTLLVKPTGIINTFATSTLNQGGSVQLDPSYLSSLKNSFIAQSTKPKVSEGLQATVLIEGDASDTFVVSDSTGSATLVVRPTESSTKPTSSFISPTFAVIPGPPQTDKPISPSVTSTVFQKETVLVGADGQSTTVAANNTVVVATAPGSDPILLPQVPSTLRPVFAAGVVGAPAPPPAAPAGSPASASASSGTSGGSLIGGAGNSGLNFDLGPMLTAVAGILRGANNLNNLNNIAAKSDTDNRRKINQPLRPNNIITAGREPLLIPVGGVGASLSSSRDHTEGPEHGFIPLRRPENQSRFPDLPRGVPGIKANSAGINIAPSFSLESFGPTFRPPPRTQSGFTAITQHNGELGPTRVSVISGQQTIFFGGVDTAALPPPGLPAPPPPTHAEEIDRGTLILQPSQPVVQDETRPVPVPVRLNEGQSLTIPADQDVDDTLLQFGFSRPSPLRPQPSRVGPQTIVSIEGDNRIVRTQVIHALPVDQYVPDDNILISPVQGDTILLSTVGVGILSGEKSNNAGAYPPQRDDSAYFVTGTETVLIGSGKDRSRTTVVRGSSTIMSGATTIFGSVFTRPANNNEQQEGVTSIVTGPEGIPTRLITRIESVPRTVTATSTSVIFTGGLTSTWTQVLQSTLPMRTLITTIVGASTQVNVVAATQNPLNDQIAYPSDSPFNPDNYPSFPINLQSVNDFNGISSDAEIVLNEAVSEDNEIARVVKNQSPDQEINVGGPVRAPVSQCNPQCSAARHEVCRVVRSQFTCVCRPGYARRLKYDSCKPSLAYNVQLVLDRIENEKLVFDPLLLNSSHPITQDLSDLTVQGIDQALMSSSLAPQYHTASIAKFRDLKDVIMPASVSPPEHGLIAEVKIEMIRENQGTIEEELLDLETVKSAFEASLKSANYSLGGTEVFSSRKVSILAAQDFDECFSKEHNDCSINANCINIKGSYTCSCQEGFKDMDALPGRFCALDNQKCEQCNYHGDCITEPDGNLGCKCQQWYGGEKCQINLRVMLIGLVSVGAVLIVLLMVCLILCCLKSRKNRNKLGQMAGAPTFLRARSAGMSSTLDRRAMIQETSSESSGEHSRFHPSSFMHPQMNKVDNKDRSGRGMRPERPISVSSFAEDRSVTVHTSIPPVLIPRVKGPAPRRPSVVGVHESGKGKVLLGADEKSELGRSNEAALVDLLENGRSSRRGSITAASIHSSGRINRSRSHSREHLADTFQRHQGPPGPGSMRSRSSDRFNISTQDLTSDFGANFSFSYGERTRSEARSYDETTVRPPVRTLGADSLYSSKAFSSQHISDAVQSVAERDGGSTVVYPQTELYRPQRDTDSLSDVSDHHSKAASSRAASRNFFS
ncbi:unnamed protein product [Meganyctiphanes norvegica]|uniref:EGF-like domain-containing protein n=1 Tax=Meganyctiphanes norvegica TaxID=48144 RepID=A0AAV2Q1L0_MEGNR